ncbi:unnamed protein product, partial [Polarella glacialis]
MRSFFARPLVPASCTVIDLTEENPADNNNNKNNDNNNNKNNDNNNGSNNDNNNKNKNNNNNDNNNNDNNNNDNNKNIDNNNIDLTEENSADGAEDESCSDGDDNTKKNKGSDGECNNNKNSTNKNKGSDGECNNNNSSNNNNNNNKISNNNSNSSNNSSNANGSFSSQNKNNDDNSNANGSCSSQTIGRQAQEGSEEHTVAKRQRLSYSNSPAGFVRAVFGEADVPTAGLRDVLRLLGPGLLSSPGTFFAPLTSSADSWLVLVRRVLCPGRERFESLWRQHPPEFGKAKMFGKEVTFHRYQQAYGLDYTFSGQTARAEPLTQTSAPEVYYVQQELCRWLLQSGLPLSKLHYGTSLVNWYDGGGHSIGAHSDDERGLVRGAPIFALSWGETRLFRLAPRSPDGGNKLEVELNDGDLVIMGDAESRRKLEDDGLKTPGAPRLKLESPR